MTANPKLGLAVKGLLDSTISASRSLYTCDGGEAEHEALVELIAAAAIVIEVVIESAFTERKSP